MLLGPHFDLFPIFVRLALGFAVVGAVVFVGVLLAVH